MELTKKQKEECELLAKSILNHVREQNPIILMNACLIVIKAAEATYLKD